MTEDETTKVEVRYVEALSSLFFSDKAIANDVVQYFCSVLRAGGMESTGWDPFVESRSILEDLDSFTKQKLSPSVFPDPEATRWRLELLFYSHLVEMNAPYEVIANLLRHEMGLGFRSDPFSTGLSDKELKRYRSSGIPTSLKIRKIEKLADDAGHVIGAIIREFYDRELRNSVSHSDFIISNNELRTRRGFGLTSSGSVKLDDIAVRLNKAKIFMSSFFGVEKLARAHWGERSLRAIPYDPHYKGVIEVLVDHEGLMVGFKVHWPNKSESLYQRTSTEISMSNCFLGGNDGCLELFVGRYAISAGGFSPLVEDGSAAAYSNLANGVPVVWLE